jgi:hypothetical protein
MPTKVIVYEDATVTVHAAVFGDTTVDVLCRGFSQRGMTVDEFAAMIYPAIDAKAKESETWP